MNIFPRLTDAEVRTVALSHGFQYKEQPDGTMDLHPYVYAFARELIDTAIALSAAPTPPRIELPKVPEVFPFPPNGRTAPIDFFLDRMLNHADSHDSLVLWTTIKFINDIRKRTHSHDTAPPSLKAEPIPMVLHCPSCGMQHIDQPQPEKGWDNPPHRSHECQSCGHIWRPADVTTVGVENLKTAGKNDSPVTEEEK